MSEMMIFKLEYDWYEGEHDEVLLGKNVSEEEFEKDLVEAREFAQSLIGKNVESDYLGKGYCVECLPQYYEQIVWYLTEKKGYVVCTYDEDVRYDITDDCRAEKIVVEKKINKTERINIP